jgi:hypothetical protein
MKHWLNHTNPEWLLDYFTNEWNPICKKGEEGYNKFVSSCPKVIHLKVDSDKFPKLRWFFDAKVYNKYIINLNFSLNQ